MVTKVNQLCLRLVFFLNQANCYMLTQKISIKWELKTTNPSVYKQVSVFSTIYGHLGSLNTKTILHLQLGAEQASK